MTEFRYDATYEPAMPVCRLTIISAATGRRVTTGAIMDTGADATIVPTHLLRYIGARRVFETGLRSQWGEQRSVFLYLVDLEINGVTLPAVYVAGDERRRRGSARPECAQQAGSLTLDWAEEKLAHSAMPDRKGRDSGWGCRGSGVGWGLEWAGDAESEGGRRVRWGEGGEDREEKRREEERGESG